GAPTGPGAGARCAGRSGGHDARRHRAPHQAPRALPRPARARRRDRGPRGAAAHRLPRVAGPPPDGQHGAMAKDGEPIMVQVDGHRLRLTNLDKVLYPATGTTKADVLDYYARIAP